MTGQWLTSQKTSGEAPEIFKIHFPKNFAISEISGKGSLFVENISIKFIEKPLLPISPENFEAPESTAHITSVPNRKTKNLIDSNIFSSKMIESKNNFGEKLNWKLTDCSHHPWNARLTKIEVFYTKDYQGAEKDTKYSGISGLQFIFEERKNDGKIVKIISPFLGLDSDDPDWRAQSKSIVLENDQALVSIEIGVGPRLFSWLRIRLSQQNTLFEIGEKDKVENSFKLEIPETAVFQGFDAQASNFLEKFALLYYEPSSVVPKLTISMALQTPCFVTTPSRTC